ncbi:hypothetical protein [Deinococcus ficus]|uniref:hypothetical protein n=1 Tax=Deinococcus ficus TaxID=317577 RepID=UPI00042A3EC8|nr:hypothetical protein [Deinococcus ficus]
MDYAIIGAYASKKLIITEFDIQRSNNKQVIETKNRKVVGNRKQSMSINLAGYLLCDSFADLEEETDKLQAALNRDEIKLVIGSKPEVYYHVSWNDTDLPRKPGAGGYRLPVSLSFEVLDQTAVRGIPCALGWVNAVLPVTDQGHYAAGSLQAKGVTSVFNKMPLGEGTTPVFNLGRYVVDYVKGGGATSTLNFKDYGAVQASFNVPTKAVATIGIVFEDDALHLYFDGVRYTKLTTYPKPDYVISSNLFGGKYWEAALDFPAQQEYVFKSIMQGVPVINTYTFAANGAVGINYAGTAEAKASVIATANTSMIGNDFGFTVSDSQSSYYTFNGITSEITMSNPASIPNITYYSGKKTLFPYLILGLNTITKISGNNAVIAWHERYY